MIDYCIGAAQFGMNYGIANKHGQPSLREIEKILKFSISNGINYIDTAQSYGDSERNLGSVIKKIPDAKSFKIITKLSPKLQDSSSEKIINSVYESIKKLNVNSLYGFLAHRVEATISDNFSRAIKYLKKEKLITKSGASVYTPNEALNIIENSNVDILQIPINILDRRWVDIGIFELAKKYKKQIFIRSIFLQGVIFLDEHDLRNRKMDWAIPYINQFNELVRGTPFSPIELAFGVLSKAPGDVVIIMGLDCSRQLKYNKKIINYVQHKNISPNWWSVLPSFPEKLLNPTLWN